MTCFRPKKTVKKSKKPVFGGPSEFRKRSNFRLGGGAYPAQRISPINALYPLALPPTGTSTVSCIRFTHGFPLRKRPWKVPVETLVFASGNDPPKSVFLTPKNRFFDPLQKTALGGNSDPMACPTLGCRSTSLLRQETQVENNVFSCRQNPKKPGFPDPVSPPWFLGVHPQGHFPGSEKCLPGSKSPSEGHSWVKKSIRGSFLGQKVHPRVIPGLDFWCRGQSYGVNPLGLFLR